MTTEKLFFDGSKGKIASLLLLPDAYDRESKIDICVLLHGIGDHKSTPFMSSVSKIFVQNGYAVLALDFNGHGESDGSFTDMTILNEIEDAYKAVLYVEGLPFVRHVILVGHSQGGVVAGMLAGKLGFPRISSLVLFAPAIVLRDGANNGNILGGLFNPDSVPDTLPIKWGVLGREYILTSKTLPIYEETSKFAGPVCLLHGDLDPVVPFSYSDRLHQLLPQSEYHLLNGFKHSFEPDHKSAIRIAAKFVKNNI